MRTITKIKHGLAREVGCTIQHTGYPCNSCFHSMDGMWNLKEDIHQYWLAVLDARGDYNDFDWKEEGVDTSNFPELLEELEKEINKEI